MNAPFISGKKLAIVPILRAGLGMVNGILTLVPSAKIGHVGLYRDHDTKQPQEYYCKLPENIDEKTCYCIRSNACNWRSACAAVDLLRKRWKKYKIFMYNCCS